MSIASMVLTYTLQDDGMEPKMNRGDIAELSKEELKDGDIGVFSISGVGTVCREFHRNGDEYVLKPLNKKHKILSFTKAMWKKVCKVVGKVVGVFSNLQKRDTRLEYESAK